MVTRPEIPALGLGTYRNTDREECRDNVRSALDLGYRHIDTAEAYGNEVAVGEGIADSGVARDEVFVATKVLHPKFAEGYASDEIVASARDCLERLGLDSVDLLYGVHWPAGDYDPEETFDACATLHDEGVVDHVGVCNLTPELLDEARDASDVPIGALQVECHPLLQQEALREYCERHDIELVAYAPLGYGAVFDAPEIREIADEHGVSEAQVSLAWLREKGVCTIPKASTAEHIRDNWESLAFDLDDEDIDAIDAIDREDRQYDPEYAPDW
ncbi:aldo/keto reductase [Halorussus amylolyticus]|uniref:aldo/keto reductase n=1 Tax=Halorussus amylolyticus TaxID=1126242 RepID=UPI0010490D32|nr:aldo/keto reductase [Halorussus amylolyticus]